MYMSNPKRIPVQRLLFQLGPIKVKVVEATATGATTATLVGGESSFRKLECNQSYSCACFANDVKIAQSCNRGMR